MLAATGQEHTALGAAVGSGKTIVGQLFARERTDRVLVALALLVFVLSVLYIVKSRLVPGAAAPPAAMVTPVLVEDTAAATSLADSGWAAWFGFVGANGPASRVPPSPTPPTADLPATMAAPPVEPAPHDEL